MKCYITHKMKLPRVLTSSSATRGHQLPTIFFSYTKIFTKEIIGLKAQYFSLDYFWIITTLLLKTKKQGVL